MSTVQEKIAEQINSIELKVSHLILFLEKINNNFLNLQYMSENFVSSNDMDKKLSLLSKQFNEAHKETSDALDELFILAKEADADEDTDFIDDVIEIDEEEGKELYNKYKENEIDDDDNTVTFPNKKQKVTQNWIPKEEWIEQQKKKNKDWKQFKTPKKSFKIKEDVDLYSFILLICQRSELI